jgi:hypothetical protein
MRLFLHSQILVLLGEVERELIRRNRSFTHETVFPSLPQLRIARRTSDERPCKLSFVTVMDGVVSFVGSGDEELGIENVLVVVQDVLNPHRVHVVDDETMIHVVLGRGEIASHVSSNDVVSKVSPLLGCVETLVHPAISTEGLITNDTSQGQVAEPVLEGLQRDEF